MKIDLLLDPVGEGLVGTADLITPFSFTVTPSGVPAVAYPAVQKEAEEFLARYSQDPTAGEALAFIRAALAPYMERHGYCEERFSDRYAYIFRTGKAPVSRLQARALEEKDQKTNKTTRQITEILKNGCIAYGIFVNDELVSLAYTHTPPTAPHVEVGVETAVGARGRGYATAALIALTNDLCARGVVGEYRCFCTNIASRRVALAAGYTEQGRFYRYTGRRGR